jgi:histidinol-phosphate aminotransferase
VIVDEAYLEFSDDYAGRTVIDLVRAGENVLVFRTFSKAFGLAALPLGYAVAPVKLAESLRKSGVGFPRSLNRLALAAAGASLQDNGYIERVHNAIDAERLKWFRVLNDLKATFTPSQANFVFFDVGRPHAEVTGALAANGIIVARAFPPYDRWIRVTIGLPEENERAQVALRKLLGS